MSGRTHRSSILTLERSHSSSSRVSSDGKSPRAANKPDSKRSPRLNTPHSSAKFDTQAAGLPIRFQEMTRITAADAAVESKSRLGPQRSAGSNRAEGRRGGEATPTTPRQRARRASSDGDQILSMAGTVNSVDSDPPIGLVVALFQDGFVCRHINKENEGVEGFAQPYDAESRCVKLASH